MECCAGRNRAFRAVMDTALSLMEATSPALPCRARRSSLVLSAVAAVSVWSSSIAPAAASSGKVSYREVGHVVMIASKPVRPARSSASVSKRVRSNRPAHSKHAHAHAKPARVGARRSTAVHSGVVPLVNTVWDDPALSPVVLGAMRDAARGTNVDPGLLMALAWRESRFDPRARSRQSSATGLLQFTSGTWLHTVREFGGQHGAGTYAAAIRKERSGELTVHGPRMRAAILALRSDPVLSARLAAEVLGQHRAAMQVSQERDVTPADLYLRHVLGPSGAARFLTALAQHPSASSLEVANRKTLRNAGLLARDGRPMTVASTYAAVRGMLNDLHARSEPLLAAATVSEVEPSAIRR